MRSDYGYERITAYSALMISALHEAKHLLLNSFSSLSEERQKPDFALKCP
jgi:hypothetical protein